MTIYIVIGVVVVFGVLALSVAARPADFKISRSATVPAAPAVVFPHVNDLHKWQAWSPWAKLDPNAKNTYEGPPEGVGASFAWDGNRNVGAGKMTITESKANELVRFRLDFEKPMKGTNIAEFTFQAQDKGTVVTWTMTGKYGFMGKLFDMIINCEKMVGAQFEKGLADLGARANVG